MGIHREDFRNTYKVVMKKLQAETIYSNISREDLLVCALALERACKEAPEETEVARSSIGEKGSW